MDNVQKFYSDVDKIKKHDRADNGGNYSGERACQKIKTYFAGNNKSLTELASSFADYWYESYISSSENIENEPTEEHVDKLASMQALLDNEVEDTKSLSKKDFTELCNIVNCEAEDIPLDLLNDLMTIFVDNKAL